MKTEPERSELFAAVLSSDIDRLRGAIVSGADLNELDQLGVTPLYYAIARGDTETVEALLDAGADIELPPDSDDPPMSPLRFAEDFGRWTKLAQSCDPEVQRNGRVRPERSLQCTDALRHEPTVAKTAYVRLTWLMQVRPRQL